MLPEARDIAWKAAESPHGTCITACLQTLLPPRAYDVLHALCLLRVLKSLKIFLEALWPQDLAVQVPAKGLGDSISIWKEEIIRNDF